MNKIEENKYNLTYKTIEKYQPVLGQTFCKLTITDILGNDQNGYLWVTAKCVCNSEKAYILKNILSKNSKSCNRCNPRNWKHGMSSSRIYKIYIDMLRRVLNPNNSDYPRYGGRGITICDRWLQCFENFYHDMIDGYANNLTLDRIDNDGNYEPKNCRWVTKTQQNKNKGKFYVEYQNKKYKIADYIEIMHLNIKQEAFRSRLKAGWSVEKATATPVKKSYRWLKQVQD